MVVIATKAQKHKEEKMIDERKEMRIISETFIFPLLSFISTPCLNSKLLYE